MIKMISLYQPENFLHYLRYLDIFHQSNYFTYMYNCSKVIVYSLYCTFSDKSPLLRRATIMNKALCIFLMSITFSKSLANTAHHSYTFK